MSKTCVYIPNKGAETFVRLKKNFGYEAAATIFNKVTGSDFLDMYKDSLTLDSEGIPTYQSIVTNPSVEQYLGAERVAEALSKEQLILDNTIENTSILINKAHDFNQGEYSDRYVAIVEEVGNGKISLVIKDKTPEAVDNAQYQYSIQKLNERVSEILSPLGVNISELSKEQSALGKVGLTDFNHAYDIANGFTGLIQVANNLEGHTALSEEFAHFVIGVYRNSPLVQRAINLLKNEEYARQVLGESYDVVYENYGGNVETIAEEAVGHILRNELLKSNNTPKEPLFKRMVNYIVNLFKGINPGYYRDSINSVSEDLGKFARELLNSKRTITQAEIIKSKRDAKFNALSEKAAAQAKVLKNAVERAYKSAALQENLENEREEGSEKSRARKIAESLNASVKENIRAEETMAAIAKFLEMAQMNIEYLHKNLNELDTMDIQDRFITLRNALFTIQAYAVTIDELYAVTTEEYMKDEDILNQEYMQESGIDAILGSGKNMVKDALNATNEMYKAFMALFQAKALPEFVKFLKPFVGENIKVVDQETGEEKEIAIAKALTESPSDVTFMQQYFSTMADNPNAALQIFDKVVKIAKDKKRQRVIEKSQEILALGLEYEAKGIKDYDIFFEEDKANYINHIVVDGVDYSYDKSAYNKAKEIYKKQLDAEYGERPTIGSSEYKAKQNKLKKWIIENTQPLVIDGETVYIPKPSIYPSKYHKLSDVEKEFYDKWMAIKAELDELIGPNKTHLTNTIKIRKHGIERLRGTLSGNGITEFVESVKSRVMRSYDDETSYVDAKGIRGFNNEEILKLPLYYIYSKGDNKDVSTDMIGTLIAYADMAYNYDAMHSIVNPLEIGRHIIVKGATKINATRGDKRVFEQFTFGNRTIKNPIYEDVAASKFTAMLNDFFESKIYGRYLKDSGETLGIDNNKAAGLLLKLGSTVQLGFNLLAWVANATTGVAMQNIEAAAGEFFTARELFNADQEFAKEMVSFMGDIGQRVKTSKLALFDEVFDVRQNLSQKIRNKRFTNRNLLTRIFGPGIQYVGQDAGDHWLYNRSAIAIALRHKMKDSNNNEISLWDALVTVPINKDKPELGMKLVLKEGVTNLDGSEFSDSDIAKISGRMRYINQHTFGVYNDEDTIAARRLILGRFVMQYRDWIPAQFRYRFGSKTYNQEKGGYVEGYYRTSSKFVKQLYQELKNGEKNIPQIWDELSDYEKVNVKRAVTELAQWLAVTALVAMLKGYDDKDSPWAIRTLRYVAIREKTELGALTPIMTIPEMIKIVKSPVANTSVISDIYNLRLLLNPVNYTDEIQSGDYKGHSSAYRAFMRSPLTLWYRTIKRSVNPEKAAEFYEQGN